MESVIITGSKGTIGTILTERLGSEFQITPFDLPEHNVLDLDDFKSSLQGHKAIIHLAWDMRETAHNGEKSPANIEMVRNVLEAALATGVNRVILASSVHADRLNRNGEECDFLIAGRANPQPEPDVPYGHSKLEIEALGREYALKGLEVVCIRFGGVHRSGKEKNEDYKHVWLSHFDAVDLVRKVLQAKEVPGNFVIIHGTSNNPGRRKHNIYNPFGWVPIDDIDGTDQ